MLTLQKLINATPPDVRERSRYVAAIIAGVTMGQKVAGEVKINTVVFTGKGRAAAEDNWWDFAIELYPTEIHSNIFSKIGTSNLAWVKCSCPFFHYNCKYAVARTHSTSITTPFDRGALAPPHIKNPGMLPFLCKHLFKAQADVVKRAQELARREQAKTEYKFSG